jgi:hypothetical protein
MDSSSRAKARDLLYGHRGQRGYDEETLTPYSPWVRPKWTRLDLPVQPRRTTRCRNGSVTEENARLKFRRYWWAFGMGIVLIRWLLLGHPSAGRAALAARQ